MVIGTLVAPKASVGKDVGQERKGKQQQLAREQLRDKARSLASTTKMVLEAIFEKAVFSE